MLRGTRSAHPRSRKCALELTDDRGRRVRRERHPALRIEAVDRVQEPQGCGLGEVFDRLTPPGEPPGEVLGERQELLRELVPRGGIGETPEEFGDLLLGTGG